MLAEYTGQVVRDLKNPPPRHEDGWQPGNSGNYTNGAIVKYPKIKAGEWVRPKKKGYKMACCDCGLVHVMEFAHIPFGMGRKIIFRAWRDERATAAMRRKLKRDGQ